MLEKGKESVLFNSQNRLSRFYLPEARKAPEYPGAFSYVLKCPERFLKGFILRGGPATADGAFPLGRKRRADTADISRITVAPRTFICHAVDENDLPQKDLPPRFHTHSPALLQIRLLAGSSETGFLPSALSEMRIHRVQAALMRPAERIEIPGSMVRCPLDERNGGIADGGIEAVGEVARHGPEHGGVSPEVHKDSCRVSCTEEREIGHDHGGDH